MHISLGGLSLQAINVSVFLYRDSGLVQRVFCKLSGGRDDFLGGRHENSSVFGGQPAGFTSNSVGTRLNEAHHDLAGL